MDTILDIPSTPGLWTKICAGDTKALQEFLDVYPKDEELILAVEPYCVIQGKRKAACLKILCNDPRFRFDHVFVSRQLYFSTREVHNVILNHPRFKALMDGKKCFMDFFWSNYPGGQSRYMGMSQRYIQADNVLRYKKRCDNIRLAFFLYPRLVKYIRTNRSPIRSG